MAAAVMADFVNSGCCQWRWHWDGGTMMQLHQQQWLLWPMVAAAMAVIIKNCAVVVDVAATIPSLVSMVVAKITSPPPH